MTTDTTIKPPVCSSCDQPTVLVGSLPQSGLHPAVNVFLCDHCRTLVTDPPMSSMDDIAPLRAAAY